MPEIPGLIFPALAFAGAIACAIAAIVLEIRETRRDRAAEAAAIAARLARLELGAWPAAPIGTLLARGRWPDTRA